MIGEDGYFDEHVAATYETAAEMFGRSMLVSANRVNHSPQQREQREQRATVVGRVSASDQPGPRRATLERLGDTFSPWSVAVG